VLTAAADMTSVAVARLLGDSVSHDADGDLDTTMPNVVLDHDDLIMLDVGFSDDESDGNYCQPCIFPAVLWPILWLGRGHP